MKIYNHKEGIIIVNESDQFLIKDKSWDQFLNSDNLLDNLDAIIAGAEKLQLNNILMDPGLLAPIDSQEIWASGVTYYNSKMARQEESHLAGGADFYAKVYKADRPELFFKANKHRAVGHNQLVRIRRDSAWNVPEPELTLVINSNAEIIGYTIGNDMCSRSIEGENPLYLPQAKTYDGCAAIGPCIYLSDSKDVLDKIELAIEREGKVVFTDSIGVDQIVRKHTDMVEYLYRECSFPQGAYLMTGTGIVPPPDFSLASGDKVSITIEPIGTLTNTVA